eukprot:2747071-Alexandrium_andersonii.AAC.1
MPRRLTFVPTATRYRSPPGSCPWEWGWHRLGPDLGARPSPGGRRRRPARCSRGPRPSVSYTHLRAHETSAHL